jgi:hypothetical protein
MIATKNFPRNLILNRRPTPHDFVAGEYEATLWHLRSIGREFDVLAGGHRDFAVGAPQSRQVTAPQRMIRPSGVSCDRKNRNR